VQKSWIPTHLATSHHFPSHANAWSFELDPQIHMNSSSAQLTGIKKHPPQAALQSKGRGNRILVNCWVSEEFIHHTTPAFLDRQERFEH
jgi:hypothetical protein